MDLTKTRVDFQKDIKIKEERKKMQTFSTLVSLENVLFFYLLKKLKEKIELVMKEIFILLLFTIIPSFYLKFVLKFHSFQKKMLNNFILHIH